MLPEYLAIGMTNEEYWNGDPVLVQAYRKANDIKTENQNRMLWLQGIYNLRAFSSVISAAFGKKNAKKEKYLEEPIRLTPMTAIEKREAELREWEKIDRALHALKEEQMRKKAMQKAVEEQKTAEAK